MDNLDEMRASTVGTTIIARHGRRVTITLDFKHRYQAVQAYDEATKDARKGVLTIFLPSQERPL